MTTIRIKQRIAGKSPGTIFPCRFFDIESRAGVGQALSRLVDQDVIRRLTQGLYHYPKSIRVWGICRRQRMTFPRTRLVLLYPARAKEPSGTVRQWRVSSSGFAISIARLAIGRGGETPQWGAILGQPVLSQAG
jgi:hypothetical protein